MRKKLKKGELEIGYRKGASDGRDILNWSHKRFTAHNFEDALRKANNKLGNKEFIVSLTKVDEVED